MDHRRKGNAQEQQSDRAKPEISDLILEYHQRQAHAGEKQDRKHALPQRQEAVVRRTRRLRRRGSGSADTDIPDGWANRWYGSCPAKRA